MSDVQQTSTQVDSAVPAQGFTAVKPLLETVSKDLAVKYATMGATFLVAHHFAPAGQSAVLVALGSTALIGLASSAYTLISNKVRHLRLLKAIAAPASTPVITSAAK